MLFTPMEAGRVKQFFIPRNRVACCHGVAPAPSEWKVVRSTAGILPSLYRVTVSGDGLRFRGSEGAGMLYRNP